ncbi:MAG: ATP-binding protein [Saprospiraceae bacterium]|nr:ATP-binding protein [Saprospiraceae bacterium]
MISGKELKIESKPENINQLEAYVQDVINHIGVNSTKFADILISLTEAVNNAMIHGNKNNVQKHVLIKCKAQKTGIYFSVKDEGDGFDPRAVPDPTDLDHIECCGGRGVHIMTQLADSIKFRDNGTRVEMFFDNK